MRALWCYQLDIQQVSTYTIHLSSPNTMPQKLALGSIRLPDFTLPCTFPSIINPRSNSDVIQVMVMKMHSYITVNGQLQAVEKQSTSLFKQLQKQTESVGGWDKALETARARQAEEAKSHSSQASTNGGTPPHEDFPVGTPPIPEGLSASYVDVKTANALRKRLTALSQMTRSTESLSGESMISNSGSTASSTATATHIGPGTTHLRNGFAAEMDVHGVKSVHKLQSKDSSEPSTYLAPESTPEGLEPHVLTYHPDSQISSMAEDYSELEREMVSSGPLYLKWPETITWKNFAVYQLVPTLVYELEYPRTDRIRPLYVFEKTVSRAVCFLMVGIWVLMCVVGGHLWNFRPSIYGHGELHPSTNPRR